jgi:1-acyl-sn-glycerol-3-phosphate acyltransferase
MNLTEYYAGKTLLLTGATGFLGKAVLEAILRNFADTRRIYVLIRQRSDKTGTAVLPIETLRTEILGSSAFNALRLQHGPDFEDFALQRIKPVVGDLSRSQLGMSEDDYAQVRGEIDVVINSGAMAVFDAPLDQALKINTFGPMRMLSLVKAAPRRPFLAHVSTCYVHNIPGPAFELPLDPKATPALDNGNYDVDKETCTLLGRIGRIEKETGQARPELLRERLVAAGLKRARQLGWNDTYTFTKAMGEQLLHSYRGEVPSLVLRPSIIESALQFPAPGWIEGYRMMDPLIVGFGRGQLTEFPGNPETVVDVVPVDNVVHALLAAIPKAHMQGMPPVLQVASGMENPMRLKGFQAWLIDYFERCPAGNQEPLRVFDFPEARSYIRRLNLRYLYPASILKAALLPLRITTFGRSWYDQFGGQVKNLRRLRRFASIYGPYSAARTRFMSFNTRSLWRSMSEQERSVLPFAIDRLDWKHYLQQIHVPGIRHYLLGESARPNLLKPPPAKPVQVPLTKDSGDANPGWSKAGSMLSLTQTRSLEQQQRWAAPVSRRVVRWTSVRMMQLIARHYLDLRAAGTEHVPRRGPFIVVSNHTSHVDTGVLLAALQSRSVQVHPSAAGDYWFRSPLAGWPMRAVLAAVPFDRKSRRIPQALALPAEILRSGHALIFYPEGSRSEDGRLQSFKSTVGLLALAASAPILPAYISGSHEALPKGKTLLRSHPVRIHFGAVIPVEPWLGQLDSTCVSKVVRVLAREAQLRVKTLGQQIDGHGLTEGEEELQWRRVS